MHFDFLRMTDDDPHHGRARSVLQAHPEVRGLFGRNPWTGLLALAIVAVQTGVALVLGHFEAAGWVTTLLAAALFGAFANHALYVVMHDATHAVIFRSPVANRLVLLLADLPNILPGAMAFRAYHLMHHAHRSQYEGDPDIPNDWEARLVGNVWWRKALWMALFPLLQTTRIGRVPRAPLLDGWAMANYACCLGYGVLIYALAGPLALAYLLASFFFATGLHPLGARWISEHYVLEAGHDTTSYYGAINRVALNIGYHNEHHDLPRIPWNRLPRLKAIAPEFYDPLPAHHSWIALFLQFLFDPRFRLYSRVVRPPRGIIAARASNEPIAAPARRQASYSASGAASALVEHSDPLR